MSLYDYEQSKQLIEVPFYSLIMAAMRRADSNNLRSLQLAFPDVYDEYLIRYNSPGGLLPSERDNMEPTDAHRS